MAITTRMEDEELARRMVEAGLNGDAAVVDDLFAPAGTVGPQASGLDGRYDHAEIRGPRAFREYVEAVHTAFPDLAVTVHDTAVDGDDVAVWWTARGTHEERIGRFEATGRPVKLRGATVCSVGDGTVQKAEMRWNMWVF